MELYLFLFVGLIARFPGIAGQGKSYIAESSNVFTTAFLKYNKYFRPYNESAFPVLVNVRMDFVKVLSVDVDAPSMTSIVDIRLKWVDGRLYWYSDIIKHVTVNSSEVWTPDVYFLNMETKPETLIDPRFLTIESTGKVFWFQRIRLLTPCTAEPDSPGNLACPVTFGSMQFPKSELDFDQIECGYSISTINGRFNVTSVEKKEVIEELPGVPFLDHTITRGSCTAFLSVDMEPTTKQQENNCQNPASTASLKSSSGSVIASLGVTFLVTLTSMVTINER